jgi:hypothetical protein
MKREQSIELRASGRPIERRTLSMAKPYLQAGLAFVAICVATNSEATNIPSNAFPLGCTLIDRSTFLIPQASDTNRASMPFSEEKQALLEFYKEQSGREATKLDQAPRLRYQSVERDLQRPTRFLVLIRPASNAKAAAGALYRNVEERWLKSHVDDINNMPVPFQVYDPCSLVKCEISIVYKGSDQLTKIASGDIDARFVSGVAFDDLVDALERPLLSYRIFSINGVPTIVFDRWRKERVEDRAGTSSDIASLAKDAWHRRRDPYVLFVDHAEVKPLAEFQREIIADLAQSKSDPKLGMRFVQYLDKQWKDCIRRDFNGNIRKYISSKTKRD